MIALLASSLNDAWTDINAQFLRVHRVSPISGNFVMLGVCNAHMQLVSVPFKIFTHEDHIRGVEIDSWQVLPHAHPIPRSMEIMARSRMI